MLPGSFFGLTLFFGIFLLAGNGAHHFMLYVTGLTGMGAFLVLTGITFPKKAEWINKSFQIAQNFPTLLVRTLVILIGFSILTNSIPYWRDVHPYYKKDFVELQGKPSAVEEITTTKGGATDIFVTIKGKKGQKNGFIRA